MSILQYLQEGLISEADRFRFENPDSFKFKGSTDVYAGISEGTVLCHSTSTYDFRANDTSYTLTLLTAIVKIGGVSVFL